jgi:hypothetical protein
MCYSLKKGTEKEMKHTLKQSADSVGIKIHLECGNKEKHDKHGKSSYRKERSMWNKDFLSIFKELFHF